MVLEIFNEFVKQYPSANLTIKIPDYKLMKKNIYPLHNVSSKNNKLFLGNQKRQLDYYNLISLISKFFKTKLILVDTWFDPPATEAK